MKCLIYLQFRYSGQKLKVQKRINNMSVQQNEKQINLSEQMRNFISGLIAGFISVTFCNPLDIARTRLNVLNAPSHYSSSPKYTHFSHAMKTIWDQQGWRGFYSGYRTNVIAIPLFNSIFFLIYEYTKKRMHQAGYYKSQSCMLATVTAGGICNVVTNPIWLVRTRLMAQFLHHKDNQYQTSSPFSVMKEMYQKEGFLSLFRGVTASLFTVVNAVIYFELYERMKETFGHQQKLSITNIFVSSTLAKVMASCVTYPITVIRTVLYDSRGKKHESFIKIARFILKQNGVQGFYKGLKPDLIRLIPSNAITFIVYEKVKQIL